VVFDDGARPIRRRSAVTKRIVSKYNQVRATGQVCDKLLRSLDARAGLNKDRQCNRTILDHPKFREELRGGKAFAQSALQICKVATWICEEAGDGEGVVLAILSALMTTHSTESDAYRWPTRLHSVCPIQRFARMRYA